MSTLSWFRLIAIQLEKLRSIPKEKGICGSRNGWKSLPKPYKGMLLSAGEVENPLKARDS